MKKLMLLVLVYLISGIHLNATEFEATLTQSGQTFGNGRLFLYPLEELGLQFYKPIKLMSTGSATVKCDGKIVATSVSLDIAKYESSKSSEGNLIVYFNKQNLPKGRDYMLTIPQGTVGLVEVHNDIQIVNRELNIPFSVPATIGDYQCDWENALIDHSDDRMLAIYWELEIAAVGEPKFLLYREDEELGEYKACVGWDWDLGQAYPEFPGKVIFEKGVHYRLVLPEGSVSSLYRDDIVNDRVEICFTGSYINEDRPLNYVWCSLFDHHTDVLDVVSFRYDRPVRVADNAKIQLWKDDSELVKEADAYLDTSVNCWMVSADFGGFEMLSGAGYSLVIPAGTVISDTEIGVENPKSEFIVKGSGINEIDSDAGSGTVYDLGGRKVESTVPGQIYIVNGRKMILK